MMASQSDTPSPHVETIYEQDTAIDLFLQGWNRGRLHHAWLLTGQQGIGKATLAYAIAKYVLHHSANEQPKKTDISGDIFANMDLVHESQSESSQGTTGSGGGLTIPTNSPVIPLVQNYSHPDFRVLSHAFNAKEKKTNIIDADQVRDVLSTLLQKKPAMGGWRVIIADSVDDLNTHSANSLLKFLEEPPERTLFLLVSHRPARLLLTVRSRCRVLPMNALSPDSIARIVVEQGGDYAPDHVNAVAKMAQGSAGLALDYLQHNALELYQDFVHILQTLPNLDMVQIHALGNALVGVKNRHKMQIFRRLSYEWSCLFVRSMAVHQPHATLIQGEDDIVNRLQSLAPLAQWQQAWDAFHNSLKRSDAPVYLDAKHVLIDSFAQLQKALQQQPIRL